MKADIWENGQRDPISILDGEIVDGRHRERACLELDLEPKYEFLPGDTDPLKFIVSRHRHRRNMNTSQAALAAARIYLLSQRDSHQDGDDGGPKDSESAKLQIAPLTQAEAAAFFGVKMRAFSDAVKLLTTECAESQVMAVDQGHVAVSDAVKVIGEPHEVQEAAVKMVLEGATRTVKSAANRIQREKDNKDNKVEPGVSSAEFWVSPNGRAALHNLPVSSLISLVEKGSVDTIIGLVPQGDDAGRTLTELRDFAAHALHEDGLVILLCRTRDLPVAFRHLLGRDIQFLCELDYRIDIPTRALGGGHEMTLSRMPLLVFGKAKSVLDEGNDVIQLPPVDDASTEVRLGERHAAGADMIIRRFAVSGGLVCDPLLLGGANYALAAVRNGYRILGATVEQSRFEHVRGRLAREYEGQAQVGGSEQKNGEDKLNADSSGQQLLLEK